MCTGKLEPHSCHQPQAPPPAEPGSRTCGEGHVDRSSGGHAGTNVFNRVVYCVLGVGCWVFVCCVLCVCVVCCVCVLCVVCCVFVLCCVVSACVSVDIGLSIICLCITCCASVELYWILDYVLSAFYQILC